MIAKHQLKVSLEPNKKIFFASDFHLGAPSHAESLVRERKIVAWLDAIKPEAQIICLVGDMFDFWFEYKLAVPRGFVRLFGKLAELSDEGIEIMIFPGNHDLWMTDYFQKEFNIKTFREPLEILVDVGRWTLDVGNTSDVKDEQLTTHNFYITHGDGLGPGDFWFKIMKFFLFENPVTKWLFGNLLPVNIGLGLGQAWATHSWQKHAKEGPPHYLGEDREWLVQYAKEVENQQSHDYYIFGHRHILLNLPINDRAKVIILGDWINHFSYGEFDGNVFSLHSSNH